MAIAPSGEYQSLLYLSFWRLEMVEQADTQDRYKLNVLMTTCLKTLPHVTISLTISLTMPVFSIVDDGIQR